MLKQPFQWLLKALLFCFVFFTPACKDSIVLDPPKRFPEVQVTPFPTDPTPIPIPETQLEIIQDKLQKSKKYAVYVPPVIVFLGLFLVLYQLFRMIHELTTTSP